MIEAKIKTDNSAEGWQKVIEILQQHCEILRKEPIGSKLKITIEAIKTE